MSDSSEPIGGYQIADRFVGSYVRAFTNNGSVLAGELVAREGKFVLIVDRRGERPCREAIVNLDKVSSITRA